MLIGGTSTDTPIGIGSSLISGVITLGGISQTGTITLGQSIYNGTINIGNSTIADGYTQNINIATSATGTVRS